MGHEAEIINPTIKCIYEVMNALDSGELKLSGIDRLLQYPEYSDTSEFREMLGALEQKDDILNIVAGAKDDDINVVLGSESSVKVMNNSSLVFKPIKKNGRTVGVIGVLGPLRMDYKNVLRTIDEIGGSVADMIGDDRKLDGKVKEGDNDGGK